MSDNVSLAHVEQLVFQLSPKEQLKLIAHVSERLSSTTQGEPARRENASSSRQREQGATTQHGLLYPTRPQPPETLTQLVGLVALGGDALADSEALYDVDWR
jgi:hypothetical protein